MKILLLHCDYIKFKPLKKAIKEPEKLKKEVREGIRIDEALVVLTAVEGFDTEKTTQEYVKNIKDIAEQLKAKKIVLYPYAHLSSNLGKPSLALRIMEDAEKILRKNFNVIRAPLGYYKEFELRCKGHPLSELSREIGKEGIEKRKIEKPFEMKKEVKKLGKWIIDKKELKENDHRILGQQLDLFSFHDSAPGMVFWHPKGMIIKKGLTEFWRQEHEKNNYKEVLTPQLLDNKIWKISGHWDHFKKDMFFATNAQADEFGIKPMNCPGHILIFKSRQRSYKELPLRMCELGVIHRNELSGVLSGLFRLIQFTQDDAHIFCTEKETEQEIMKIIRLISKFYKIFDFPYKVELSTRPEKAMGSREVWDKAERELKHALKNLKIRYKLNPGDGAFYGPKIDFHIKDSLGRTWQCATIQLDFQMPERFKIEYIGEDNKKHRPIMIHRTVYGSLERFIGILIEHYSGKFPTWLAPVQVKLISFTDRNKKITQEIAEKLRKEGLRIETDLRDSTIDYKVREAELQRIPYIIVIGDKEEKSDTLAVRERGKKPKFKVKLNDFLKKIKEEIKEKK